MWAYNFNLCNLEGAVCFFFLSENVGLLNKQIKRLFDFWVFFNKRVRVRYIEKKTENVLALKINYKW